MEGKRMRSFWDRRAHEDAFHFVDNRCPYRRGDPARFWSGGEEDLDVLLTKLGAAIEPGDRVLEIGCGVGRMTRPIAARAAAVVALDVSAEMLELARRYNEELENVEWVQGDGTSLTGVEDASVDACVSYVVFQHIPDPAVTLGYVREIARVLRPGGWTAFQVSNDPSIHRSEAHASLPVRLRQRLLAAVGRFPRGQARAEWLGSAIDLEELERVAQESGMGIERVVGAGTQFCLVLARRIASEGPA